MKRSVAFAIPLSIAIILTVVLVVKRPDKKPAVDRPEAAAYMEFLKTLNPETGTVPMEKRFVALRQTREMMALKTSSSDLSWESQVADMGGRTRTLLFDPNDPTGMGMFAGSVTGGLWYNDNVLEGNKWMPVNDFWPNLSISCMAYDPNNTNTFYIGTGESETALVVYRESSGRGSGLFRSNDAGHTWDLIPSTADWAYVTDLAIRSENGVSVIYAGVVSGIYKGIGHPSTPSDGLYRSTNGGENWTQVLPNIPGKEVPFAPSDICLSADQSRILVGTTYGINSKANDNDRTGAACILFSDDGLNWTLNEEYKETIAQKASDNKPGRVMLTEAPSDPDILYAIIGSGYPAGAFYGYGCEYLLKSTDKGLSWTELNFPDGWASLAWHAFTIAINPENPDVIWLGGLDTWRSTDGGANWLKMSDWAQMYGKGSSKYVHGDIHQILHRPNNGNELYIATDGGVFATRSAMSPDNVVFFERNRNYNTLQYYTCAISPIEGDAQYIGGLQDNGTMHYRPGRTPTFTDMLSGGDGAYCFFDPDDPGRIVTCSQYATIYQYQNIPDADPVLRMAAQTGLGIFINPMDYDWKNDRLYMNTSYFNGNRANEIAVINLIGNQIEADVLSLASTTSQPFTAVKFDNKSQGAVSTVFFGTASGELYRLDDATQPDQVTELTGDNFPTAYMNSIELGQSADTILITFSNYSVPSVFLSTDAGVSWHNLEGNLPDMPVRWAILHPQSSQHIMLATETGTWTTDDAFADQVEWKPDVNGLANVRVDMLRMRESDLQVLAATHGRGLFTTKWNLSNTSGINDLFVKSDLSIYPNPSSGQFRLNTNLADEGILIIRDATGRLVQETKLEAGINTQNVDLSGLNKGIYFIRIDCLGETQTGRVLIN